MRRIIVGTMLSLDGVMQGPGGPDEDRTGGFAYGGWVAPYWDEVLDAAMSETFDAPFDLLLGRFTYDIFAAYWPFMEADAPNGGIAAAFNRATKYVATRSPETLGWANSAWLGPDPVDRLRELKAADGPDLLVQGSGELVRLLMENDLVDEFRLTTFPLVLGQGKRLFGAGSRPGALRLTRSTVSPSGVVIAAYERAGEVRPGSFVTEPPSAAEIERRKAVS